MKKALIAMSGGVDSSVAAYLMQQAGYDCQGVTMRLYRSSDLGMACHKTCCAETDAEDAALVCFRLGIAFEELDYSALFRYRVIERFAAAFSNCGFIGIPLIRASIGDEGVFFLVGLLIPFNVIQWVYGAPMLVREAQGGEKAPSRGCADILKHVIWNPMVIASCIGVLLFVTGLGTRLPSILLLP